MNRIDLHALDAMLNYLEADTARYITEVNQRITAIERKNDAQSYIWRTSGDERVRPTHAENNSKVFSRSQPPPTGHPGEDFNCRCWAEPIGGSQFVEQTLTSKVNDNLDRWTDTDFTLHYLMGSGMAVTLEETGYLGEVIHHFSDTLNIYENVNQQIMQAAIAVEEGVVPYEFNNSYNFREVLFTFRNSTVEGQFDGGVRKEQRDGKTFLVVNGIMNYTFFDKFEDPISVVEALVEHFGLSREQAQQFSDSIPQLFVRGYDILGAWQTKLNGTLIVTSRA